MTNDLITEARELCEKATPGKWHWEGELLLTDAEQFLVLKPYYDDDTDNASTCVMPGDAAFIARSRTLIPELCDALEKAERESGCEWCADNYDHRHKTMFRKGSDWNYEAKYCDMCGKRLEVKQND